MLVPISISRHILRHSRNSLLLSTYAFARAPQRLLRARNLTTTMPPSKRKRSTIEEPKSNTPLPPLKRRASSRNQHTSAAVVNPDLSADILDAPGATRASPDNHVNEGIVPNGAGLMTNGKKSESPLSDAPEVVKVSKQGVKGGKRGPAKKVAEAAGAVEAVVVAAEANGDGVKGKKGKGRPKISQASREIKIEEAPPSVKKSAKDTKDDDYDPEGENMEEAGEEEVKDALARPPPVNSDYLPLPWKGRLGYACLNTYLRNSNPPVFSSRTCRIASILEHRHPLADPSQPEHPTKNRPDKNKPADIELGKRYVEALCLANVKDIIKMVRWNDKYNIRFMRLSSEMFPFASHEEYGYKLAPFASEALAEAGKVIAELGHRVTTHPGQFTQLGSPRKPVIENSIRDLDYHDEMLSLLKLPTQLDKDAVMILHMGGMFEGKKETLDRFRENYARLSPSVKNRLVLENDDMGWSVHDLLPLCEELNIPFVLDFHHHNIVFDSSQIREGTKDIMALFPRIKATWTRKGITQKMHYSEPTPPAITARQRRKHSPRVATLPPCPPDMDLMIEAKDKEQAVFELMRTFKLPGFETFNDVIPYVRSDDNKAATAEMGKRERKKKGKKGVDVEEETLIFIDDEEVGMGGAEGRVYWPPGMEEWLRPKKREVKKKDAKDSGKGAKIEDDEEINGNESAAAPATKKTKAAGNKKAETKAVKVNGTKAKGKKNAAPEDLSGDSASDLDPPPTSRKAGGRKSKKSVNYTEDDDDMELEEA